MGFKTIFDPAFASDSADPATYVQITDDVGYRKFSTGTRWRYSTRATEVVVRSYRENASWLDAALQVIGARVIVGSTYSDRGGDPINQAGFNETRIRLGQPGVLKTVDIFQPLVSQGSSATPAGTYLLDAEWNEAATPVTITNANKVLIYGDSITSGAVSLLTGLQGYAGLLKRPVANGGIDAIVMQKSVGGRKLSNDCSNASDRTAFATAVAARLPTLFVALIGTNDYGANSQSASSFGTAYAGMLDALRAASPTLKILCVSPLVRATETANTFGDTLGAYRSAISSAVTARSGWALPPTFVDGTTLITLSDLAEGLHPTTGTASGANGHYKLAAAMKTQIEAVL